MKFDSKLEDYSDKYKFNIKLSKPGKKSINLSSTLSVTDFYDDKGYLHRYKVKEFLDASLHEDKFSDFGAKKKK